MSLPLDSKLPNGSTLSDWLGTCATSATVAGNLLHAVRNENTALPLTDLARVDGLLRDALDELAVIRDHITQHLGRSEHA